MFIINWYYYNTNRFYIYIVDSIQIIFKNLISLPESFDDEEYRDTWNANVEKSLKSTSVIENFKKYYRLYNRVNNYHLLVVCKYNIILLLFFLILFYIYLFFF